MALFLLILGKEEIHKYMQDEATMTVKKVGQQIKEKYQNSYHLKICKSECLWWPWLE